MTRIANVGDLAESLTQGRTSFYTFRKIPTQASVAGWWVDMSMAGQNAPPPNYYAAEPLIAVTPNGDRGLWHGGAVAPASKVLSDFALYTPTAALVGTYYLLDYLLYYPFVDLDSADVQEMDNTIPLPRYTDGVGVKAMVVAVAPTGGNGSFTFDYVNQDGVPKTAPVQNYSAAAASIASLVTSEPARANSFGPFLRLADGDSGVRRITSWTNTVANGGLGAVVLVKPLVALEILEANTWNATQFPRHRAETPVIEDGAYLHLIMNCAATVAAGTLVGALRTAWK